MTIYLTAEQILFIHYRLLSELVASMAFGILGCWNRPFLSPDIFEKAAALMESLVDNRPFINGIKRTGIACTVLFLRQNGITFRQRIRNWKSLHFVLHHQRSNDLK